MVYYLVVGAGSFGRGISDLAATAEWARRVNADRVRGDKIEVKIYRGEDIEFPPASADEWGDSVLTRATVKKLHAMAEMLQHVLSDPEYVEEELKHFSF